MPETHFKILIIKAETARCEMSVMHCFKDMAQTRFLSSGSLSQGHRSHESDEMTYTANCIRDCAPQIWSIQSKVAEIQPGQDFKHSRLLNQGQRSSEGKTCLCTSNPTGARPLNKGQTRQKT